MIIYLHTKHASVSKISVLEGGGKNEEEKEKEEEIDSGF